MRHAVTIRIAAVLTLRGFVEAEAATEAELKATSEAGRIASEFTERAVLEGKWPEVLGGARVTATTAPDAEPSVTMGS